LKAAPFTTAAIPTTMRMLGLFMPCFDQADVGPVKARFGGLRDFLGVVLTGNSDFGSGFFRMSASVLAMISPAGIPSTSATLSRTTTLGLWIPRSTKLMNDRSSPAVGFADFCRVICRLLSGYKKGPKRQS
jgi:hypothetical protein